MPTKVATFYTHLERLLVTPTANVKAGERVRAGQPIGIIGADPLDGEHLKHLHFEIWLGGPKDAIDPAPASCARVGDVVPDDRGLQAHSLRATPALSIARLAIAATTIPTGCATSRGRPAST